MNSPASKIIIGCWIIYLAYWVVSARGLKPVAERQSRRANFAYRCVLLVGGTLLWLPDRYHPLPLQLTPQTDALKFIGAAVCLMGLWVAIWARWTLAGNWSSDVTFKQGHELIQSGPYRFVRHPIYTGIEGLALGTAIAGGEFLRWLGFLILFAGFWIKLSQEETLMLRHFPDEYPGYKRRVRALIPFVL